jgi:nickel-dependent lactate racemase
MAMYETRAQGESFLSEPEIRELLENASLHANLGGKRVLVIIPDRTRSGPIPMMFRLLCDVIGERAATLDFLIALGTHPALTDEEIDQLVGATPRERASRFPGVKIFNHRWDLPETFTSIGKISESEIATLTEGLLVQTVDVRVNRLIYDYDQLIICGPTFPHEVVGFSGGNKYFFPGIGGSEIINFTHWLGALKTSFDTIGTKRTPIRNVIDRATSFIDLPKLCFSMVVRNGQLAGLYADTPEEAFFPSR